MNASIIPFFSPSGIVVIGASSSAEKLGYGVARNLTQSGYPGAIYFVGQKEGELFGRTVYTDLSQVPEPVDLAILIIPPASTAKTIEECAKCGIQAAIIMSSGFKEVGTEGAAIEQQCLHTARQYNVRLLGPNCIGIIDTHLPLDTSFLQPPMPAPGHIGFISHSGAFCAAIIDWSRKEGFSFSQMISLGNQVDVNETDALAAIAEDEYTRAIVLYMESVSDGSRFVEVAREVTQHKPVIALKAGRFTSGQKAAASHTGALAASDIAFEAAFEKSGVLRAATAEQLFDWARALESYPNGLDTGHGEQNSPISGIHGIAVLTNAGGPGVIAADSLEQNGLPLAQLSESTRKALSSVLPPAATIHNPVDMLASASPGMYASCLRILLEDDNVDGVLVILPPPPMFKAEEVAEELVKVIESDGKPSDSKKPVVISLMGSTLVEKARAVFESAHVPTYPLPERAASALAALARRREFLTMEKLIHRDLKDSKQTRESVASSPPEELLKAYGIETAPMKLATSVEEALSTAEEFGYPVVMKIASPDILHKSDVDGVTLNIQDANSLHNAYTQMIERLREKKPEARIDGIHIQQQIPHGQEVIVGALRDPQFGPLIMFGSGGVEVEGLKDVSFALAPLTSAEASRMIRRTWAGRKLKGFRHIAPVDEESVIDVLINLSSLITTHKYIEEIEINPLKILERGAVAVDVRVR